MNESMPVATAAMMGAITLLLTLDASAATMPTPRQRAVIHRRAPARPATPAVTWQAGPKPAVTLAARTAVEKSPPPAGKKEHHLILQVNTNDPAAMNLALNNAVNVAQYYQQSGEPVKIEVVAFGPGLHMLREDTSPVKARIETMALSDPEVSFKACDNTLDNMRKAENKDIPIVPQAERVKSGVVHIMELEEQGWTYVKP